MYVCLVCVCVCVCLLTGVDLIFTFVKINRINLNVSFRDLVQRLSMQRPSHSSRLLYQVTVFHVSALCLGIMDTGIPYVNIQIEN